MPCVNTDSLNGKFSLRYTGCLLFGSHSFDNLNSCDSCSSIKNNWNAGDSTSVSLDLTLLYNYIVIVHVLYTTYVYVLEKHLLLLLVINEC